MAFKILLHITAYIYFGWNVKNNVIKYDDLVDCSALAYINFTVIVFQLYGDSKIPLEGSRLVLDTVYGGYYQFVCMFLTSIGVQYSKYIEFKLQSEFIFISY